MCGLELDVNRTWWSTYANYLELFSLVGVCVVWIWLLIFCCWWYDSMYKENEERSITSLVRLSLSPQTHLFPIFL